MTIPHHFPPQTFIVHPDVLDRLRAAYPGVLFEGSTVTPRGWVDEAPAVLLDGPYRPVLFPSILRAVVGATCPAPTGWQTEAWTEHAMNAIADKVHRGRDLPDAHPHYYHRETPEGPQTIRVHSVDEWLTLLAEDVQADIVAAATRRAKADADRAAAAERRRVQDIEDEARTVRFIADLTAIGERLAAHDGGFTKAVIDLHRPEASWHRPTCAGCDQGCSCDAAEWPCSTVELVCATHGLEVPPWHTLRIPRKDDNP